MGGIIVDGKKSGIKVDFMATPRFQGSIDEFMTVCDILKKSCAEDKVLRIDTVPLPEHRFQSIKPTGAPGIFRIEGRNYTLQEFMEFLYKVQDSHEKLKELGLIETNPSEFTGWIPQDPRPSPLGFSIYIRGK